MNKKNNLVTQDDAIRKRYYQTCFIKDKSLEEMLPQIYEFKDKMIKHKTLYDLFQNDQFHDELLICAGASRKSLEYLTSEDKKELKEILYNKYRYMKLEDAIDVLLYRYIIQKGDSFAGAVRNRIGFYGKDQIIYHLVNLFKKYHISFHWFNPKLSDRWITSNDSYYSESTILKRAQGFAWKVDSKYRMILFNQNIPYLNKNVDIVLLNSTIKDFIYQHFTDKYLMMGEIKSGIDLKNSDEHWKQAIVSLERIKNYFKYTIPNLKISLVAGAITEDVADEITERISDKKIDYAVNVTDDDLLEEYCNWILSL